MATAACGLLVFWALVVWVGEERALHDHGVSMHSGSQAQGPKRRLHARAIKRRCRGWKKRAGWLLTVPCAWPTPDGSLAPRGGHTGPLTITTHMTVMLDWLPVLPRYTQLLWNRRPARWSVIVEAVAVAPGAAPPRERPKAPAPARPVPEVEVRVGAGGLRFQLGCRWQRRGRLAGEARDVRVDALGQVQLLGGAQACARRAVCICP